MGGGRRGFLRGVLRFFLDDETSAPDGFSSAKRLVPFYCPFFSFGFVLTE